MRNNMKRITTVIMSLMVMFTIAGCQMPTGTATENNQTTVSQNATREYGLYAEVNNNNPEFTDQDRERLSVHGYEYYSALDELGRCGYAEACVGTETMPTEKRGSIGQVKPSGWHTVKYDNVDGKYLYNRCHLIGFQLTGENANDHNLITGTRQLNVEGQLPFENKVAEYVKNTGHHVMYRVTPIFEGDELVAREVKMEAQSIEDNEIHFNVLCHNTQDGIEIDYATGDSHLR